MAQINSQTVLALADDASIQSVGDGAVVLLAQSGQLFTCNESTEAFLVKVDGVRSFADIVALLGEEFEVDAETATRDFQALAGELIEEGVLARP